MKFTLTDYFTLTLEDRKRLFEQSKKEVSPPQKKEGLEDSSSFLETLRAYQLSIILGKYKLF